ncbi:MAG: AAA family ATPase [bacterium]
MTSATVLPATLDLNPEFRRAHELMEASSGHLLVTGKAGTGKSTLLSYFRGRTNKRVAVLAPTGVAALNVEGETIHSFFRFGTDVTPESVEEVRNRNLYANLDAVVIDEVSMVRADLLDCVDAFLRLNGRRKGQPFGGTQMILIGDLYQLPPVLTPHDRAALRVGYPNPYFFGAHAFKELDLDFVELERVYRQKDAAFIAILNAIRNNTVTAGQLAVLNARVDPGHEPAPDELVVCLTPTNRAADDINARRLAALPGAARTYRGASSGAMDRRTPPAPEELAVKPGAQIMMVSNDGEGRWVNGSMGRVTRILRHKNEPDELHVALTDGTKAAVGLRKWDLFRYVWNRSAKRLDTEPAGSYTQYPLRLAWAVTIHKSQGKSFDRVIVDLGARVFATGQVYVALSRCTTLEGLTLRRPLRREEVFVDRRIVQFVTGYQYARAEKALPVARKLEVITEAIRAGTELTIIYLKATDERSTRTVSPREVGEMEYRGRKFLGMRALCGLRGDVRVFRLDRILALSSGGGSYLTNSASL